MAQFIVNPTYAERAVSKLNIMVVGTKDGIVMVESGAKESRKRLLWTRSSSRMWRSRRSARALRAGEAAGKTKARPVTPVETRRSLRAELKAKVGDKLKDALDTQEASEVRQLCQGQGDQGRAEEGAAGGRCRAAKKLSKYYELLRESIFREQVLNERIRPDIARSTRFVRSTIEVGVLPRVHGSALFTRGETQALVSATLGTTDDAQRMESYEGEQKRKLHAALQLPAVLGWRGWAHDRRWPSRDWSRRAWHGVRLKLCCRVRMSRRTRCAWFRTFWSRTDRRRWRRFAELRWR
jgi:polyribonucleotide nucleotidyltransferase